MDITTVDVSAMARDILEEDELMLAMQQLGHPDRAKAHMQNIIYGLILMDRLTGGNWTTVDLRDWLEENPAVTAHVGPF